MQKMKLYNGKAISGYTEDSVKNSRKKQREGMNGISPRYVRTKSQTHSSAPRPSKTAPSTPSW